MANSRLTQSQWSQRMYDARSATYDDSWHPVFAAHLVDLLDPKPGQHILDLAAGTGLVSLPAAARVAPTGSVLAVDVSVGMLEQANGKLAGFLKPLQAQHDAKLDNLVRFVRHDITRLDEVPELRGQEGLFDAVACVSALVLLTDPLAALREWCRYLKQGGTLVVDVPHEHNQRALALMERAARNLNLDLGFHRAWMTGENVFRDMIQELQDDNGRVTLRLDRVDFVEQTGEGVKRFGRDDADNFFDGALKVIAVGNDPELKERLREAFHEEWVRAFDEGHGAVEDRDGVYVAVATRL